MLSSDVTREDIVEMYHRRTERRAARMAARDYSEVGTAAARDEARRSAMLGWE